MRELQRLQRSAGNSAVQLLLSGDLAMPSLAAFAAPVQRDDGGGGGGSGGDQMPTGTITDDSPQPDVAKADDVPDPTSDASLTAPAKGVKKLIDSEIAAQSTPVVSPVGGAAINMFKPIADAYAAATGAIDKVGSFVTNLATAGARAAVNFARSAITTVAAAAGPIGWILGAAATVVDHFVHFTDKAADAIISGLLSKVNAALLTAKAMIWYAFMQAQLRLRDVVAKGEAESLATINGASGEIMGLINRITSSPVYTWISNAVSQVINIWRSVVNAVPAPLRRFLPTPPNIPVPNLNSAPAGGGS